MEKKNTIRVTPAGTLVWRGKTYHCALGKSGVTDSKQEGDGATPAGIFPLREVFYRPDRLPAPETDLPISELVQSDGWCDDPNHPAYNKKITLPHAGRYEELWREDAIYDVIIIIGYNDNPSRQNQGSTIFLHIAREAYQPTEGCVALKREDLLEILKDLTPGSQIEISAN